MKTPAMHPNVTVVDHPLVTHKLSFLRDKTTHSSLFRALMRETGLLIGYEVLRDLALEPRAIETPMGPTQAHFLKGKKLVFVPILRAGLALTDGLLDLAPSARVGHLGIYRDSVTHSAVEYFSKLPDDLGQRLAIVVAATLATGSTAAAAITRLKEQGAREIRLVALISAPEGIAAVTRQHPDVRVFTAAIDQGLDAAGFIVPGIGDAGDRLYGTK